VRGGRAVQGLEAEKALAHAPAESRGACLRRQRVDPVRTRYARGVLEPVVLYAEKEERQAAPTATIRIAAGPCGRSDDEAVAAAPAPGSFERANPPRHDRRPSRKRRKSSLSADADS